MANKVRLCNNHVKVAGYHVIYDRRMISKGSHVKFARFVLLAVSEEAKAGLPFFLLQCIIKQLLDRYL